jgi:hypothetical protein
LHRPHRNWTSIARLPVEKPGRCSTTRRTFAGKAGTGIMQKHPGHSKRATAVSGIASKSFPHTGQQKGKGSIGHRTRSTDDALLRVSRTKSDLIERPCQHDCPGPARGFRIRSVLVLFLFLVDDHDLCPVPGMIGRSGLFLV